MKARKFIIQGTRLVLIAFLACSCKFKSTSQDGTFVITNDTTAKDTGTTGTKAEEKTSPARIPLKLVVKQLASPTAPVVVGIYNSNTKFLYKEGRLKEYTFFPGGNTLTARIKDIPYGEIAVVIYQDMNGNGKFDRNIVGLPAEGYAFSNNYKPMVKSPDFDDCKFGYNPTSHTVTMNLIRYP